jgi:hypothetical protein
MGEHIPKFKSEEEEVAFWDKTSVTSLSPDLVEEIQVERPPRPLSSTFAIRLDQRSVTLLREIASEYSLGPTQLVRKWVNERIKIELEAGVLAPNKTSFNPGLERIIRKQVIEALMQQVPTAAAAALDQVDESAFTDAVSQFDMQAWDEHERSDETAPPKRSL